MTTYTPRFKIPIADFNQRPWHATMASALERIDYALWQQALNTGITAWGNGVAYLMGAITIDEIDGSFWIALVSHTSEYTGTFSADRSGTPERWTQTTTGTEQIQSVGDTDVTILNDATYVVTSVTLTAFRTWTLPPASSVNPGHKITIADPIGTVPGATFQKYIIVDADGSDLINGQADFTIDHAYGVVVLQCDGISKWTIIGRSDGYPNAWFRLAAVTFASVASIDLHFNILGQFFTQYEIVFRRLVGSVDGTLNVRTSTDFGASFDAGANDYSYLRTYSIPGAPAEEISDATETSMIMLDYSNTDQISEATFSIIRPDSNLWMPQLSMQAMGSIDGELTITKSLGMRNSVLDTNALRFLASAGTISGSYYVYGRV